MSITRNGINRTEAGALGQASFEETVDILFRYGADEKDPVQDQRPLPLSGKRDARIAAGMLRGTCSPMC